MEKISIVMSVLVAIVVAASGLTIWAEETGRIRYECVDRGVVEVITEVSHRRAFVRLEDGRETSISQPRNLVPGKTICMKSEKIYDF